MLNEGIKAGEEPVAKIILLALIILSSSPFIEISNPVEIFPLIILP